MLAQLTRLIDRLLTVPRRRAAHRAYRRHFRETFPATLQTLQEIAAQFPVVVEELIAARRENARLNAEIELLSGELIGGELTDMEGGA